MGPHAGGGLSFDERLRVGESCEGKKYPEVGTPVVESSAARKSSERGVGDVNDNGMGRTGRTNGGGTRRPLWTNRRTVGGATGTQVRRRVAGLVAMRVQVELGQPVKSGESDGALYAGDNVTPWFDPDSITGAK